MKKQPDYRNLNCWYEHACLEECSVLCERYSKMKYLMDNSGLFKKQQMPVSLYPDPQDLESFKILANIKLDIYDFVTSGKNLYLCSDHTGNGKTSWALKLLLRYFDQSWHEVDFEHVKGLFVFVPQLVMQLKDFSNPVSSRYKQSLIDADLVVWDDIAYSRSNSNYDLSNILIYINQRIAAGKSNIYTSNIIGYKDLEDCLSSKLASRIMDTATIITFKGVSKRD